MINYFWLSNRKKIYFYVELLILTLKYKSNDDRALLVYDEFSYVHGQNFQKNILHYKDTKGKGKTKKENSGRRKKKEKKKRDCFRVLGLKPLK